MKSAPHNCWLWLGIALGLTLCVVSTPGSVGAQTAESNETDKADTDATQSRAPKRPPISKGDLGVQVAGGLTGMLAGPIAGGLAGGLVVWSVDAAVSRNNNVRVSFREFQGAMIGAGFGMLAGVPTGVLIGGHSTAGRGNAGATYLGSLAGAAVGGGLWAVTVIGTRDSSLGFGIPVTAFGLISGGVIGYRLSAPSTSGASSGRTSRKPRMTPVLAPTAADAGVFGIRIQFY